jgi:2-polyprenyl-3-methyl-5-hydroxy-6-metoxy-1,4-benzoquinol methylase
MSEKFPPELARMFPTPDEQRTALDAYSRFVAEIIRLQIDFERTGKYPVATEGEAWEGTYSAAEYMDRTYLPALLLAWYLWPHQRAELDFFTEQFVPLITAAGRTHFYEVGIGTGIYSRLALESAVSARLVAYDIGPASLAFAQRHLATYDLDARCAYRLADCRIAPPPPLPFLICVELIEHMEDPVALLRTLRSMTSGKAFIATALNAPNRDHIYLYQKPEDVMAQLREVGFKVLSWGEWEAGTASVAAFICE